MTTLVSGLTTCNFAPLTMGGELGGQKLADRDAGEMSRQDSQMPADMGELVGREKALDMLSALGRKVGDNGGRQQLFAVGQSALKDSFENLWRLFRLRRKGQL